MRLMTCAAVDELAAELALDVLDGEDRGAALAHLERCAECRENVARMTDSVETLLQLVPPAEPSTGFEDQVLERLDAVSTPPIARTRRFVLAVDGTTVGYGYLHQGRPAWLVVSIAGWERQLAEHDGDTGPYRVRLARRDGTRVVVGDAIGRDGTWASRLPVGAGSVASVTIVDSRGHVWCTGSLDQ
jgi:predicted anti-sigma-YlaC factor YlaD